MSDQERSSLQAMIDAAKRAREESLPDDDNEGE